MPELKLHLGRKNGVTCTALSKPPRGPLPVLRFEIEKSLADGSLEVDDVPRVWNQKMREYLGVDPKDDGEGCLQDMVSTH